MARTLSRETMRPLKIAVSAGVILLMYLAVWLTNRYVGWFQMETNLWSLAIVLVVAHFSGRYLMRSMDRLAGFKRITVVDYERKSEGGAK